MHVCMYVCMYVCIIDASEAYMQAGIHAGRKAGIHAGRERASEPNVCMYESIIDASKAYMQAGEGNVSMHVSYINILSTSVRHACRQGG